MPSEVTLTSGRVLRNVEVVRWESNRVVLRYSGGIDPIAFTLFATPAPAELPGIRKTWELEARLAAAEAVKPPATSRISGQVFVTTRGAGAYKFAGANVRAYPEEIYAAVRRDQPGKLPMNYRRLNPDEQDRAAANAWFDALEKHKPVGIGTTDADGNYSLEIPAGQAVFLVAAAGRRIGLGRDGRPILEQNVWVVPVSPGESRVDLNGQNNWRQPE
jgi:hypothetical protein